MNFRTAWGTGQYVWAAGHRFGEFLDVIVQYDGASWSLFDHGLHSSVSAIWGTGADGLWIGGDRTLSFWDGSHTTEFDMRRLFGIANSHVVDVWGSASDDVWAIVLSLDVAPPETRLVHFDGALWNEVATPEDEETPPETELSLHDGCAGHRDNGWLIARPEGASLDTDLFHWNGSEWQLAERPPAAIGGGLDRIDCRGDDAWFTGVLSEATTGRSGEQVLRWHAGMWREQELPEASGTPALAAVWAGDGEAWVVGTDLSRATDEARSEIWHYEDGAQTPTLPADVGAELDLPVQSATEAAASPLLRAIWTNDSGRTFVFGVNGIILESVDD